MKDWWDKLIIEVKSIQPSEILQILKDFGWPIVKALLILIIGFRIIKYISRFINHRLEKSKIDPSLRSFLIPLFSLILKTALIITIMTTIGIEMTSFIALLGSFGLAVGLALQGGLSNFAGGVLILMLKPFKVGDFIEANGFSGTVKDIQIFYTVLATPDNKKVVMPNADLSNSSLINYSAYSTRRIELKISCAYHDDINKVKDLLMNLISTHELVLKEPLPVVYLGEYGASSINFIVRGWVQSQDYWMVYYDIMYRVKSEFDKHGISIPFNQLDVHLFNQQNQK